jgi:hypothetical protein
MVEVANLPGVIPDGGFVSKVSPCVGNAPAKGLEQVGTGLVKAQLGESNEENIMNGPD